MESPGIYKVNTPTDKRTKVLKSPYFTAVKDIALAISAQGYIFDDDERLVRRAIGSASARRVCDRLSEGLS